MSRLFPLFCFLLISLPLLTGQSFQQKIDRFVDGYSLRQGNISICILDIAENQVIADHRAERVAVPASALKLITTGTALSLFGPDFRFPTELQYDGTLAGGRLNGNLWIKGFGDPTLGSADLDDTPIGDALLQEWVSALRQKGLKAITGAVIGDGSHYDSQGAVRSWQWADLGNYYGAGARGLNWRENTYTLYFARTGRVGDQTRIARLDPDIPWLEFVNEVKQAGARTGDQAYIFGGPYADKRYIRGTIPAGSGLFDIDGSIPDPPYFLAYQLTQALKAAGITVEKAPSTYQQTPVSGQRRHLLRHQSPPLATIVERTNYRSVNLYAEALLKEIGRQRGDESSTEAGADALLAYWADRGVSTEGIQIADGSGLSNSNAVSARFLAEVLRKISLDDKVYGAFKSSIPLAGRTGSLSGKFKGSAAEGNLYAKSGTLGGARSYAGYFTGANGRAYAFAVLVNNYNSSGGSMRLQLDRLLQSFCE